MEEVSCRPLSWSPAPVSVSLASVSHHEACLARPQLPRSEVGIGEPAYLARMCVAVNSFTALPPV
jgi:hypothetical protein